MTNQETTEQSKPKIPVRKKAHKERQSDVSRTVITRNIRLETEVAQKVFDRSFDHFCRSAYTTELVASILCTEDQADVANSEIESILSLVQDELNQELARLNLLIDRAAIRGDAKGKVPLEMEVEIDSQYAGQFIKTISLLDQVIMKIDTLWLNGEMDRKQRSKGTFQWQQRVNKVAGKARQVAQVLQKRMREKNKQPIPEFPATLRIKKRSDQGSVLTEMLDDFEDDTSMAEAEAEAEA